MRARSRVTALNKGLKYALLVIVIFLAHCSITAQEPQNRPRPIQTPITEPVILTVTVTDRTGRYVQALEKDSFRILDNKVQQEITHFDNKESPVSVGVLLDASGSIDLGRKVKMIKEGLTRFIQLSNNSNEYFLLGFNEQPQLLLDWTQDGKAVLDKISFPQYRGQTALYDACYLGVEKVTKGTHKKHVLVLITDGQDNSSRYHFRELENFLKESDVLVYTVGLFDTHDMHPSLVSEGQDILRILSLTTGGRAFIPRDAHEVNQVFEVIAQELRLQYSVGIRAATSTKERDWRRIKVNVTPSSSTPRKSLPLKARSREGYYALNLKRPLP